MTMTSQGKNASTSAEFRRQAARAAGRLRKTAVQVGHRMEAGTPDPVLARAIRTAKRLRVTAVRAQRFAGDKRFASARAGAGGAAAVARANRTALTTVAGVLAATVLARTARRARRARRQA
ncbi:hypothetical protein AB0O22_36980 [Streptomyces sp. NPDC091204]|uniref:hypothetical protein n=1 Tax=Streptomyces sp. NPDC091204 TaxID=3155299 RepID=UPI00343F79C8